MWAHGRFPQRGEGGGKVSNCADTQACEEGAGGAGTELQEPTQRVSLSPAPLYTSGMLRPATRAGSADLVYHVSVSGKKASRATTAGVAATRAPGQDHVPGRVLLEGSM